MSHYSYYPPYVPVAKRRAKAEKFAKKMMKKETVLEPVQIEGRKITTTFWGKAWCDNLEAYSDYESRLPRGRTYARNGSVIDLKISKGTITALISGSEVYTGHIKINPISTKQWEALKKESAGKVGSLIELLGGKLSQEVMAIMTNLETGLFPKPKEIHLDCSCPDWADLCKNLAGVLYGIGSRLDTRPELLFLLRSVNHEELVDEATRGMTIDQVTTSDESSILSDDHLSDIFGIDLGSEDKKSGKKILTAKVLPSDSPVSTLLAAPTKKTPLKRRLKKQTPLLKKQKK
ncbi:MAG: hypothetical protein K2W97_09075 [Chthoniobacterales bacterium]|nr:hypothetical protein [Chthoniobacterales bacterium]